MHGVPDGRRAVAFSVENLCAGAGLSVRVRLDRAGHDGRGKVPHQRLHERIGSDGVLGVALALGTLLGIDGGGRGPSLPKFMAELRAIRQGDEEESPDEG
ncbi:hypothetical protein ACQCQD_23155, partial [Ralstonia pseudosolanacearum]|uniref:hypothetical protein n=1 Tax=Ralstonia pseudosolanacearum TaxID=1310165 RepID=UPI003CEE93A4